MCNMLDINKLKTGFNSIKIGELTFEVIKILNLNRTPCDIILWEDRFKYIEKHRIDFSSDEEFDKHIAFIPKIISDPDYIGKHPSDNSIQYIKRIDRLMIVAIRLKSSGNLSFRSSYILSETQLIDYIKSGTVWEISNNL